MKIRWMKEIWDEDKKDGNLQFQIFEIVGDPYKGVPLMGEGLIRSATLRLGKEGSRVCWGGLETRNVRDLWGLPNVSVKANKKSTTSIVTEMTFLSLRILLQSQQVTIP
jgi:hypothetical protein